MKYFENELSNISEIARQNDYPAIKILEQCITAIALAKEIQEIDKEIIFHGGTATQFYLGKFQRLSQDADLITKKGPNEIKEIVKKLEQSGFTFIELENGGYPILRYLATHKSLENPADQIKVKLEITHSVKCEIPINVIEKINIFNCNVENLITLPPSVLLPRKLLTFNLKNCGLRQKNIGNIAKHTYDSYSLINIFKENELTNSIVQFDLACAIETSFHAECNHKDTNFCLENISNNLFSISNLDFAPNQYKMPSEIINAFDATPNFLKTKNRRNRFEWVSNLLELNLFTTLLLKSKKDTSINFSKEFFILHDQIKSIVDNNNELLIIDKYLQELNVPKVVRKRDPRTRILTYKLLELRKEIKLPIIWDAPILFNCPMMDENKK